MITPRSKNYAIKYHWFWSYIKPSKVIIKNIELSRINLTSSPKVSINTFWDYLPYYFWVVGIAVRSRGSVKIRRLVARVMRFSKSKIKYVTYFVPPKPQKWYIYLQINIFNSFVCAVISEPFKYSKQGSQIIKILTNY